MAARGRALRAPTRNTGFTGFVGANCVRPPSNIIFAIIIKGRFNVLFYFPHAGGGGFIKRKIAGAFVELLKVKSIVTFIVIGVMAYLVIRGDIGAEAFTGIAGCIITYYFTRKEV